MVRPLNYYTGGFRELWLNSWLCGYRVDTTMDRLMDKWKDGRSICGCSDVRVDELVYTLMRMDILTD